MANFSETQIQGMITALEDEFGPEIATRELAILELEDLKRKGCTLESISGCRGCSAAKDTYECPLYNWEKRHPEYRDDELAMRIKVLEAGGEEAYKEKQKCIEEAKKKAEELHKKEVEAVQAAYDLKAKVIEMLDDSILERYVQQRIHLALNYGKSSLG